MAYEVWTMELEEVAYQRYDWNRREMVDATPIYEEAVRTAESHYRDVPSVTVAVFYVHEESGQYFRQDIWETEYREEHNYRQRLQMSSATLDLLGLSEVARRIGRRAHARYRDGMSYPRAMTLAANEMEAIIARKEAQYARA